MSSNEKNLDTQKESLDFSIHGLQHIKRIGWGHTDRYFEILMKGALSSPSGAAKEDKVLK